MSEWRYETFDAHTRLGLRVKEALFSEQSRFQKVEVVDAVAWGRVLILDDVFMTSEYDEFLYHEMLVHPAMATAPAIKRVLVIGGGDGGTVREVLRHPGVQTCVMIEIDELVVQASKRHLPSIGAAWDDPRLDVRFIDGVEYVRTSTDPPYDVILLDGTDPIGPGEALFGVEFYKACKRMLSPGGVMALQSESPLLMMDIFAKTQQTLRGVFREVHPYFGPVPLYGTGVWSWTWCSDTGDPRTLRPNRGEALPDECKAYNAGVHDAAFARPNYIRDALARLG